jgi:peptidoglycan hydrolase-like protein with peptidoglycan-binding domain
LRFLGYYEGHINGQFDSTTEAAVIAFQLAVSAAATGTLDLHGLQHLREYSDHYHYGSGATHADYGHGHSEHHGHGHHHHGHHEQHAASQVEELDARADGRYHEYSAQEEAPVVHDPSDSYYRTLLQTLDNISSHAIGLAAQNDAAVLKACQAFKSYALGRIQELEGKVTGEDIAKQVTRSLMDAAGIRICKELGSGLGKWFIEQISTGLARKVSGSAKSALSTEGSGRALRDALEDLITDVETAGTVFQDVVAQEIHRSLEPLVTKAQNHTPLTDEDNWIGQFWEAGPAQIEDGLMQMFGLPAAQRLIDVELAVYEKLIEDFTELMLIKTEHNHTIFPERNTLPGEAWHNDPHRQAHKAAQEARDQFETRLRPHPGG